MADNDISIWEQGFADDPKPLVETTALEIGNEIADSSSEEWQYSADLMHLHELMMTLHDQDMGSGTSTFYCSPTDALFYSMHFLGETETPAPRKGIQVFCINRLEGGDGGAFGHVVEVMHDPERSKAEKERQQALAETFDQDGQDDQDNRMVQIWKYRTLSMGEVPAYSDHEWQAVGNLLDQITWKQDCSPRQAMEYVKQVVPTGQV